MRLFLEHEFAGEEVFEGDELRVIGDDGVGALLEGQHDIHAETMLTAGAFLRRSHDAVCAAGDGHVPLFHHSPGELKGQLIVGIVGRRACRSEHADLQSVPVALEYSKGMPQFLQRPIHDFEVQDIQLRFREPDHTRENFLHERGLDVVVRTVEQGGELRENLLFGRGRLGAGGGAFHGLSPNAR